MNKNVQKPLENNQESSPKTEIMVDDEDQDKDQEVIKNMTKFFKDMFNAEKIRRNSQTFRQNNRTSLLPKKNWKKN